MAKKPDITTIASGYYSRQALNTNFENLQDGFDNTLSLDGSTPNSMGADLDMNSNDILNAQTINAEALKLDGTLVGVGDLSAAGATLTSISHTGDGSTVAFSTGYQAFIKDNAQVYIDGVYQNKAGYSISGTTLTFSEAPPLNSAIEIVVARTLDFGADDAANVNYTQGGTGSVNRTVLTKLQETVSVKDFGAVGDGVADDTAAIQAALDYAQSIGYGSVHIPSGTYIVSSTLSVSTPIHVYGDGFSVSTASKGSIISTSVLSGNAFEFVNSVGSFDNGLLLEDFAIVGPNKSGSAKGLVIQGSVWTNSTVKNITIRTMGGVGVSIEDCLTANFENVRAQANGGNGFNITGSNGVRLFGCMSESNSGLGYSFSASPTEGDNGPVMIACHAEENTGGSAVKFNGYINPMVHGCWIQVANSVDADRAAIDIEDTSRAQIVGNYLTTNSPFPSFSAIKLTGSTRCTIISNSSTDFAAARGVVENATSSRNAIIANSGDGAVGEMGFTTSSSTGSTYVSYMGAGGEVGPTSYAARHTFLNVAGTELARVDDGAGANTTGLVLYDVQTGAVARVKVGANNSGGTGFRMLTIDNS